MSDPKFDTHFGMKVHPGCYGSVWNDENLSHGSDGSGWRVDCSCSVTGATGLKVGSEAYGLQWHRAHLADCQAPAVWTDEERDGLNNHISDELHRDSNSYSVVPLTAPLEVFDWRPDQIRQYLADNCYSVKDLLAEFVEEYRNERDRARDDRIYGHGGG